jgi:hypothetical protein
MHWIEQLLHVEPDAGSGTAEFVIYLVVVTVATLSLQRLARSPRVRRLRRALSRSAHRPR